MNVAKLDTYRAKDTIDLLTALLKAARKGQIHGVVIAWKSKGGKFEMTVTGDYARDYIQAMGATGKLFYKINEKHEHSEVRGSDSP